MEADDRPPHTWVFRGSWKRAAATVSSRSGHSLKGKQAHPNVADRRWFLNSQALPAWEPKHRTIMYLQERSVLVSTREMICLGIRRYQESIQKECKNDAVWSWKQKGKGALEHEVVWPRCGDTDAPDLSGGNHRAPFIRLQRMKWGGISVGTRAAQLGSSLKLSLFKGKAEQEERAFTHLLYALNALTN